ncbi:hypothetical protein DFQ05_1624 [Winogradskyella wandonensis]|uniref:DUF3278 domain-containing protein n=1 Tax=Winogradskyella wandonensis TaxID=1442586 RepID=A0A4R1KS38_9FLAO|nr:hypothetical protein [Winogradskyella wandonensis]TCK67842.1 hypothetical protein DFQ05_1624 [Winogradskyella wandonensis]
MENDNLNTIWNKQNDSLQIDSPSKLIKIAKNQRKGQILSLAIMATTVVVLIAFTIYTKTNQWNDFALGLTLMISSLFFRIILEMFTLFRKDNQLVSLDSKTYQDYLKKHYKDRLTINYIITPLCFIAYVYGFIKLLPFFKVEFSNGFYTYILVSGIVSLLVILYIIIKSILKENRFLQELKQKK